LRAIHGASSAEGRIVVAEQERKYWLAPDSIAPSYRLDVWNSHSVVQALGIMALLAVLPFLLME
jgi:hypothetical protein